MKKLTALILMLAFAMPAAAEDVDRTLKASPDGEVDVSNIAGSVTISGWSRDEVEVTGTLGRNVKELVFERDGDTVNIQVKVPRRGGKGIESDLEIKVPQNSSLEVSTVSADIEISGTSGEQELSTVSGDIETETAGNDIAASAVSGDIEISGDKSSNETNVSTVSGDVTLFRGSGTVRAESVSGDVLIDEGIFGRADLGTVNGEVVFRAGLEKGGRFSAETVNGDIDVEFVGAVSAKIDIETFNGRIRNCFGPEAERTSKYTPGWELSFTEGDGDGRIDMSTMNGSLSICKK
jgi:DUF4097 and DUF4098 domain-containing protein YvlB